MFNQHFVTTFYKDVIAFFCAASIGMSPVNVTPPRCHVNNHNPTAAVGNVAIVKQDTLMRPELWLYLRKGINYLEASGKDVPINFRHPGGKAYGPLALTPVSIKDVRLHYPSLSGYTLKKVLLDREIYERFAAAYTDLLLKHYLKIDYSNMPKEEVFAALQKAWFLGPTLYKKGRPVIASRGKRAAEYIDRLSRII